MQAAFPFGRLNQLPENGASNAFDQIVIVEKDAVIGGEVAHRDDSPGRWLFGLDERSVCLDGFAHICAGQGLGHPAELLRQCGQHVFIVVCEAKVFRAFDIQHTIKLRTSHNRYGQLAAALRQAGHGNGCLELVVQPRCFGTGANSLAVDVFAGHVRDANGRSFTRRNTDHAVSHRDFGADARVVVAPACDGEQALATFIQLEDHDVLNAASQVQGRQRVIQQFIQVFAGVEHVAHQSKLGELIAAAECRNLLGHHRCIDFQYFINVRSQELEDVSHARMRCNARQLGFHALKQRPMCLSAQVTNMQPVATAGDRVYDFQQGVGIAQNVLSGLVEELKGQCHMAMVYVLYLREVRDIGGAILRAGGQGTGNGTFEAVAKACDTHRHAEAPGMGCPARGPGVCSNTTSGVKLKATIWPDSTDMWVCPKVRSNPI